MSPRYARADTEQMRRTILKSGDAEVLHSNERPNISAAFGTSTPPSGLSGALRRFAFRYSESSYAHWLPLMLADPRRLLRRPHDGVWLRLVDAEAALNARTHLRAHLAVQRNRPAVGSAPEETQNLRP